MQGLWEERRGDATIGGTRIKWWHFKDEKQSVFLQKILKEDCVKLHRSKNVVWKKMAYEIRKVAKKTLGELIGFGPS